MKDAMRFVLLNESGVTDPAHGGELTPAILGQIAGALTVYLDRDVAGEWGGNYSVVIGAPADTLVPGDCPVHIVDTITDDPNAAAYHTVTDNGDPVIYAGRTDFDSLISGAWSLSVGLGHEFAETVGNRSVNLWAMRADYKLQAHELCDRVEGSSYEINGVAVPNFLLQSAFAIGAPRPWDFLGVLTSQDGKTAQGYSVVWDAQGPQTQEMRRVIEGEIPERNRSRVSRKHTRLSRLIST